MNKTIRKLHDLAHIVYLPLDLPSTYVVGYADAAFANNFENSSQLGYIVLLKHKNDRTAIIHYGLWKCQRVTRSVLGAEVHAFSHGLDFVLALSHDLSAILQRKDPLSFSRTQSVCFTLERCL